MYFKELLLTCSVSSWHHYKRLLNIILLSIFYTIMCQTYFENVACKMYTLVSNVFCIV